MFHIVNYIGKNQNNYEYFNEHEFSRHTSDTCAVTFDFGETVHFIEEIRDDKREHMHTSRVLAAHWRCDYKL